MPNALKVNVNYYIFEEPFLLSITVAKTEKAAHAFKHKKCAVCRSG